MENNDIHLKQSDDSIRIQDLLNICLKKWYWFALSLAITTGVAAIYILTTPPVYTRSALLLLKDDGNGKSSGDAAGVLGDFDLFRTSTNINNEIQSLQSPAIMHDVVKRLKLNVNY